MLKNDFAAHPLLQKVQSNLRPLLDRASRGLLDLAQKGKIRSEENARLSEYEFYDYDVFYRASAAISAVGRLKQSQQFIRTFPRPRSYEKLLINQHIWIEYHYSFYVITLVSLFDIALILTNSVFRLGNREQDCKEHLIMNNGWVGRTSVKGALDNLKKLIEPHKAGRNLNVHRGEVQSIAAAMKSEELDRLALINSVRMLGGATVHERIIDLAYKGHVKKICYRLVAERDQIGAAILRLFDCLLPIYADNSNALHEKWRQIYKSELERRKNQKK
jgi:hypothetical protein